jgi:hypothetical protein
MESAVLRAVAQECLLALKASGRTWHRRGRITRPGESIIFRTMSDAFARHISGGMTILCHGEEDRYQLYDQVVDAVFALLKESGKWPRSIGNRSTARASRSRVSVQSPLSRNYDPIFDSFWRDDDGNEYGPWVPNPDSTDPDFGTRAC